MISSEMSVYMLTVITIDRAMAILFPLKFGQLEMKKARMTSLVGWILCLVISLLPVVRIRYFGTAFFGGTG